MTPILKSLACAAGLFLACATAQADTTPPPPPLPDCKYLPDIATITRHDVAYTDYNGAIGQVSFWQRDKVCYADAAVWWEPQLSLWLTQRASIYSPVDPSSETPGARRPVVIFTHPYGGTAVTEQFRYVDGTDAAPLNLFKDSTLFQSVLVQALQAGYTVVSLEFRHPLSSYDATHDPQPGNTDVRDAVQYLRYNAESLHIDPNNVFLVGQSRGSLNMLWAIKDDATAVDPQRPWRAASSKVNAVWDYQPQTCYDRDTVKQTFVLPAEYKAFLSDPKFPEPKGYPAGCALAAVANATALPPIVLMYDEEPANTAAVTLQHYCRTDWSDSYCWKKLGWHDAAGIWNTWFDEHDANFGVALAGAYGQAGAAAKIQACYGVAVKIDDPRVSGAWNGYRRYTDFFDQHQSPPLARPPVQCPVVVHKPRF